VLIAVSKAPITEGETKCCVSKFGTCKIRSMALKALPKICIHVTKQWLENLLIIWCAVTNLKLNCTMKHGEQVSV
jgi:hypothetical protein